MMSLMMLKRIMLGQQQHQAAACSAMHAVCSTGLFEKPQLHLSRHVVVLQGERSAGQAVCL
jgi:hypothetical protein